MPTDIKHTDNPTTPVELRSIFGRNLKLLCSDYSSVAALCREIGIHRTQFNRYLSGESFPRPDILHQLCMFFDVDARILLEPISPLNRPCRSVLNHPLLVGFIDPTAHIVSETRFPSGFYRVLRRSFIGEKDCESGLVYVFRDDGYTFMRGYEPRDATLQNTGGVPPVTREFRGVIQQQEEGVMVFHTHRDSLSGTFNFLTPETSFQSNLWEGYATRTMREKVTGQRAVRLIYEHLGDDLSAALATARSRGRILTAEIPRYHQSLLQVDREFR